MIKINVKKIVKILAIFIIIMIMCLCCTVQAATNKNEQVSNLIEDVTDEEEVSTTIKDLILTINSEGMSKSLLAETINLYTQLTKTYTNSEIASMIEEEDLVSVKASAPGFLRRFVTINEEVNRGQLLGEVINPYNGEILSEIRSTADGIIFYAEDQPTILENASAFQVIKKLHE